MGYVCYLCNRKASRNDNISLHSFPKDPDLRQRWKKICGFTGKDDVSRIYICSAHFSADNLEKVDALRQSRMRLKIGAVPSISVPVAALIPPASSHNVQNDISDCSVEVPMEINADQSVKNCSSCLTETAVNNEENIPYAAPSELHSPRQQQFVELRYTSEKASHPASSEWHTPRKRRFGEPRYISEISTPDFSTPKRAHRVLKLVKETDNKKSKTIKRLHDQVLRLKKHISSLQDLMQHLTDKGLMTEEAGDNLLNTMPQHVKQLMAKKLSGGRGGGQYSEELRSFALTLYFYSPKAYNYVRKTWDKLLPCPSAIRSWYRAVNGSPGFTKEALDAIKMRASQKKIVVNLTIDEMSIKEEIIYQNGQFHGGVDCGNLDNEPGKKSSENDNVETAKSALTLMAVSLNESWKVPIGYFLIRGLSSRERADLLKLALATLHDHQCDVYSITFDGASTNLSMCVKLGCNFTYGPNFKPFFTNPVTSEPCYIFLDFCHMIKLIRNTLADWEALKISDGGEIRWSHIVQLYKFSSDEGLKPANKLTKKHIYFKNNKMNVKLAIQTLSESVSKSLIFLNQFPDPSVQQQFSDVNHTAEFCLNFNNMGDMLNCKNVFSKHEFNKPLNDENYSTLKSHAVFFEKYINSLCTYEGKSILNTGRCTGFLGMIVCLRNMFPLFDKLKSLGFTYLLTYKLSQDYLETFFSAIRSRGGFNNNPNALQFKYAYKRLLIRHELKEFENGNCLFDGIDILHVSSRPQNYKCPIGNAQFSENAIPFDHDYIQSCFSLSSYVESIVSYISGYISYKLQSMVDCVTCKRQLTGDSMPLLSKIKNRGPFLMPSKDVEMICKISERIIRQHSHVLLKTNVKATLINKIMGHLGIPFDNNTMNEHVMTQDIFDNHRYQLSKNVIEFYLKVRMHAEAKKMSEKECYVRSKYTKLILFSNQ